MCGICGFISKSGTIDLLKAMNATMVHRGPNDNGEEILEIKNGYGLGLGHRRLSILDLSENGHQPMHSADGRVSLVFNGEIYNHMDIRKELKTNYPFTSTCDTQTIIAAYMEWGISCVEKFEGMFAIALYDRECNKLFLIRDRMGKKPLYYWVTGDGIYWGSGLSVLCQIPQFDKSINKKCMPQYLNNLYISGKNSIFENVYKVQPGEILTFCDGKIESEKYWDIAKVYGENKGLFKGNYNDALAEFGSRLEEAVKKRLVADVPVGAFLSGGYDSSLISAIANSLSSKRLKTYSIGFSEEKYDESKYAKKVAKFLETDHTSYIISENEMIELVQSIPIYYDEPFADSSQVPSMLVAKLAKRDVEVVLSGDGGDELFGGYDYYYNLACAQRLDIISAMIYKGTKPLGLENKLPFKVRTLVNNRDKRTKTQFGREYYESIIDELLLESGTTKYVFEEKYPEKRWNLKRMLLDQETYLPNDILCKVDRATMKYSLEARCPLLDYNIVEFSYRLPESYKCNGKVGKRILKDLAYEYIPSELLERPKAGFSVPLEKWLKGPLKEQLMYYASSSFMQKHELFNATAVNQFIGDFFNMKDLGKNSGKNYSKIIWAFFIFSQWYEQYM